MLISLLIQVNVVAAVTLSCRYVSLLFSMTGTDDKEEGITVDSAAVSGLALNFGIADIPPKLPSACQV